jgi:Tat protein translocase TatB subunit
VFGIGGGELVIILLIAFIFLGPDKFPELAKSFGKSLRSFKNTGAEIKKTIYEEVKKTDVDKMDVVADLQNEIKKVKQEMVPLNKDINETIEDIFNSDKS